MRSKSQRRKTKNELLGQPVTTRPVDQCMSLHEAFQALPRACGATAQSSAYNILYRAITEEVPLVLAISGIASLSNIGEGSHKRKYGLPTDWIAARYGGCG